jgi:hypothetical protein
MDEFLREQPVRIYAETKTIAVVGTSRYPFKPSQRIPRYLQEQGYRIRPVNPRRGLGPWRAGGAQDRPAGDRYRSQGAVAPGGHRS